MIAALVKLPLARRLALALNRWRRRARVAADIIFYEAPRQIRITRARFRGETEAWATPQTALERFLVRGFFAVLAFIAAPRDPRARAGELIAELAIVAAVPMAAYLLGLIVGRLS